ncbi:uncharacterized protein ACIB01_017466 [Guaruba guarouba]
MSNLSGSCNMPNNARGNTLHPQGSPQPHFAFSPALSSPLKPIYPAPRRRGIRVTLALLIKALSIGKSELSSAGTDGKSCTGCTVGQDEAPPCLALGGRAAARPLQRRLRRPPRCGRQNRIPRWRRRRRQQRGAARRLPRCVPRRGHPGPWLQGGGGHRGRRCRRVRDGAVGAPAAVPSGSRHPRSAAARGREWVSCSGLAGYGCEEGTPQQSPWGPAWWCQPRPAAGTRGLLHEPRAAALSTGSGDPCRLSPLGFRSE